MDRFAKRRLVSILLTLTFIMVTTPSVWAKTDPASDISLPDIPGIQLEGEPTEELPQALKNLAEEKARQEQQAPTWVKRLWRRKLSSYFVKDPSANGREELFEDARKLHEYYEQNDSTKEFENFEQSDLKPKVDALSQAELKSRGIDNWTVEEFVVEKELSFLSKSRRQFFKKSMELVTGPHLFGASRAAARLAIGAAAGYGVYRIGGGPFIAGMMIGAIQAGPLAALVNASTSWFLNPTTEFIKVYNARYTGGLEQRINHFFDKLKPKDSQPPPMDSKANSQPHVANLERDGMNFAYMTPEDQRSNWEKNLRVWVAVAKRFGQLLRDTHHQGRVLMMIAWSDEQNSTQLVEVMDVKLVNLNLDAENLMTPYKTALLIRNESEKKDHLMNLFDQYQELCESAWMNLDMNATDLENLNGRIKNIQQELLSAGVSQRDMKRLNEIQVERAKAVGTLVTALTVNEIRSFSVAEANRNLEAEARQAQRVVRRGYQLQSYVEKYLPLVQEMQRKMGFQNSGASPNLSAQERFCETFLSGKDLAALPR